MQFGEEARDAAALWGLQPDPWSPPGQAPSMDKGTEYDIPLEDGRMESPQLGCPSWRTAVAEQDSEKCPVPSQDGGHRVGTVTWLAGLGRAGRIRVAPGWQGVAAEGGLEWAGCVG